VTARQGGRFLTLSFGGSKADRMAEVIAHYRPARTIALGDAPNDIEMLEAADIGVIVGNPHHSPLPSLQGEDTGRIIRTDRPGPVGWNRAVLALLDRLGLQKERQGHG
jgi:mannosyl-3-phosphoglycerate phosphatase